MERHYLPIADLLQRVRTRWRGLVLARAFAKGAWLAAAVLGVALGVTRWLPPMPTAIAFISIGGVLAATAAMIAYLLPARRIPTDLQLARFIEEQVGTLDERLVTAVDLVTARCADARPAFAESMVRDAARATSSLDASAIVRPAALRRAVLQAVAAALVFAAIAAVGRHAIRRAYDATTLAFFPGRITIEVIPGDARIEAGTGIRIEARLVGNEAPVVPQLQRRVGARPDEWQGTDMPPSSDGPFVAVLDDLTSSFDYRVIAGGATSKTFTVSVVRAPRVARIDVDYVYPKAFNLAPRTEEDGGDIYAPPGTAVRNPRARGHRGSGWPHDDGERRDHRAAPGHQWSHADGQLTVNAEGAYRVVLADAQGLASRGETEYFIRTMDDRPPDVHVVKPASDRRVTPLEEVDIEAEATDDFGVAGVDLVYAVNGGKETLIPLRIANGQFAVSAAHVLYLEDLDVRPGDFLSYYVRARDVARGRRSVAVTSDIFFLEIKNFEEEFTLAQSQAAMGGGASNPQLDELVAAQKEIIVATWKLDRRSRISNAQSAPDIRAVAAAETELSARVDRVSSALRASTMRDPRARARGRPRAGQPGAPASRSGSAITDEEALRAAAVAMGAAADALNRLKTAEAVAPEMEALNHLLRAQADIRKREVQQQAGGGSGGNRNIQDLSSLFDKELARHQQTNYENRSSATNRDHEAEVTDRIKDLASRQDELLKRQEDLASRRPQIDAEELKRALEKLTREQDDLRQRAVEVAQQIAKQSGSNQRPSSAPPRGQPQPGAREADSPGQAGGVPQAGASARATEQERRLREITDDMRAAANGLRAQASDEARALSARARDRLRSLERQMSSGSPEGRRRALGGLQFEARQLADAERQLAAEGRRIGDGQAAEEARRQLAAEQERLADRLRDMQERVRRQSGGGRESGELHPDALQEAASEAGRELERQRLADRMQQSADAIRGQQTGNEIGSTAPGQDRGARSIPGAVAAQEEIARALDRVADRLARAGRGRDGEADRLAEQRVRAQELRDRLNQLTERLGEMDRPTAGRGQGQSTAPSGRSADPQGLRTADAAGAEVEQLRAEMNQQLTALRALMDEAGHNAGPDARGRGGRTFEGQVMTLSAPGTEAFKQDFARWQELKRQATAVLEGIESSAAQRLQAKESKDRLTAGADDRPPSGYQSQVDSYFKALSSKKVP